MLPRTSGTSRVLDQQRRQTCPLRVREICGVARSRHTRKLLPIPTFSTPSQIALFVALLLVFLSYVIGPRPMDLLFTSLEVVAVGLSVGIMALISNDGESHWMEGVQLLAVYIILGIAFFFLPH